MSLYSGGKYDILVQEAVLEKFYIYVPWACICLYGHPRCSARCLTHSHTEWNNVKRVIGNQV
jgi:hypothetical protein